MTCVLSPPEKLSSPCHQEGLLLYFVRRKQFLQENMVLQKRGHKEVTAGLERRGLTTSLCRLWGPLSPKAMLAWGLLCPQHLPAVGISANPGFRQLVFPFKTPFKVFS